MTANFQPLVHMFKQFLLAFVPLFIAVDAVGALPIFVSLTRGLDERRRKKVIAQSVLTAATLAIGFIFLGKGLFRLLGIGVGDFMVAGGLILLVIAVLDLALPGKPARQVDGDLGVVPLGTPLIAGPAVLTTSLVIIDQQGLLPTLAAVCANILIVGLVFRFASLLTRLLGRSGAAALSKVMALFLAAIAVMMVRKGLGF